LAHETGKGDLVRSVDVPQLCSGTVTDAHPSATPRGAGVIALVLGIVGLPVSLIPVVGIPLPVLGLIMGIRSIATPTRGAAIAGIVTSSIGVCANGIASVVLVLALSIGSR
jgi:hypothetical protein